MSQSRTFTSHNVEVNIKAGTKKTLTITMDEEFDLTNGVVYNTALLKVWKPGELLFAVTVTDVDVGNGVIDRTNNSVTVEVPAEANSIENAGNWEGEIEFRNTSGEVVDHSFTFNYNILYSL